MNLSVIDNLTPATNEPHVLRNVARWHLGAYRNGPRNAVIADALYDAAATADELAVRALREAA